MKLLKAPDRHDLNKMGYWNPIAANGTYYKWAVNSEKIARRIRVVHLGESKNVGV